MPREYSSTMRRYVSRDKYNNNLLSQFCGKGNVYIKQMNGYFKLIYKVYEHNPIQCWTMQVVDIYNYPKQFRKKCLHCFHYSLLDSANFSSM